MAENTATNPPYKTEATSAEKEELALFYSDEFGTELQDNRGFLENAHILVVEKYISGSPGYVGPVYFVLFDGGPECYDVLIRNREGNFDFVEKG